MRDELSDFMNGSPVEFIAEFIGYGNMNFEGEVEYDNPLTYLITPMEFVNSEIPIAPMKIVDKTTIVRPISVNKRQINNISEMWIGCHLQAFPDGYDFNKGDILQAFGYIWAYTRKNMTRDFCFVPCSSITHLK